MTRSAPRSRAAELAAFLPDCVVLLRRLLGDPRVPRRAKLALAPLLPYLASPIGLIPHLVPVLRPAADAVLAAPALPYVVRRAGPGVVEEVWPGSPARLPPVRSSG